MLCVWWLDSSGTTVWVSESDTKQITNTAYWCHHGSLAWESEAQKKRYQEKDQPLWKNSQFSHQFTTSHKTKGLSSACLQIWYRKVILFARNMYIWFWKKNANPRILIKETLKTQSCGKLSERTLRRVLCRKEASNKYWSCLLLFSSFAFKYMWLNKKLTLT